MTDTRAQECRGGSSAGAMLLVLIISRGLERSADAALVVAEHEGALDEVRHGASQGRPRPGFGRAGGATKLAMAGSGASIGAPGAHAERHVSPRGSSTVSGYGSVDPGSADRWRNTKLSRKYAPFILARRAAQISKNFGRKSGPPKFR